MFLRIPKGWFAIGFTSFVFNGEDDGRWSWWSCSSFNAWVSQWDWCPNAGPNLGHLGDNFGSKDYWQLGNPGLGNWLQFFWACSTHQTTHQIIPDTIFFSRKHEKHKGIFRDPVDFRMAIGCTRIPWRNGLTLRRLGGCWILTNHRWYPLLCSMYGKKSLIDHHFRCQRLPISWNL